MKRRDFDFEPSSDSGCRECGKGWIAGLVIAGAAIGIPALVSEVIRRRAEAPQAPRWGRARRYAGEMGEIVFQELGHRRGDAPPVVLLHGFGPGYGSQQWRSAAELLAAKHAVYVPDLPGWGRSSGPGGAYDADLYLTVIEDFLSEVVREPAVIVAAGLSAAYAARIAAEIPRAVSALALVSPLGLDEPAEDDCCGTGFVGQLLSLPVIRGTVLDLLTSRSALEHHLRREAYAAPERVDAALLDHHYRASHRPEARAALAAYLRGDLGCGVGDDLEQIRVPVWIAWGRSSAGQPVERAEEWLARLPEADLEILEGSGSLPHAETPALFAKALEKFLEGLG